VGSTGKHGWQSPDSHLPMTCGFRVRRALSRIAPAERWRCRKGRRLKIAFQGIRGAYSEAALLAHFGGSVQALGFAFSEQVFDAVEAGEADRGFVPVENSIAGPVGVNNDLLLERDVFGIAESYFRIEHCLL